MRNEIKSDYCIIGAGIAGILLASKLAGSGKKILIMDQGPRFTEQDRSNLLQKSQEELNDFADYNDNIDPSAITPHTSASAENETVQYKNNRLFGFGGTALHFQGIMMRPIKEDLKVNTLYGYGRDWPISYSELEPWLLEAEYETGVSANEDNPYGSPRSGKFPMSAHKFSYFDNEIFGPALKKLGIVGHSCPYSLNYESYRGRSGCLACRACKFCPSGARYSPDRVHLPILDKQQNVRIMENISLRRLETGQNGESIVAAHAINIKDRKPMLIQAKHYILATGGVEAPRMLLLSADSRNHKNGLGNMGGQLGLGFNDHAKPSVLYDLGQTVGSRLGFETMVTEHFRTQQNRMEQPTFLITAAPSADWFNIGSSAIKWTTADNIISLNDLRNCVPHLVSLWTMIELEGNGILELDNDVEDDFGSPVAKITLKMTDRDRIGHSKSAEIISQIGDAMGTINVSDISPSGYGKSGNHPSGATAMAKNPDEGVCDTNLKVFGLDNLYVVGSSVFPHMGCNPPTLTIAALALRLAEHFKGRRT